MSLYSVSLNSKGHSRDEKKGFVGEENILKEQSKYKEQWFSSDILLINFKLTQALNLLKQALKSKRVLPYDSAVCHFRVLNQVRSPGHCIKRTFTLRALPECALVYRKAFIHGDLLIHHLV